MQMGSRVTSATIAGMALIATMTLTLCSGSSSSQDTGGDITGGVWVASGGTEDFYWELWRDGDGFSGVVHTVRDGKKQTELPVDSVTWHYPSLRCAWTQPGLSIEERWISARAASAGDFSMARKRDRRWSYA